MKQQEYLLKISKCFNEMGKVKFRFHIMLERKKKQNIEYNKALIKRN